MFLPGTFALVSSPEGDSAPSVTGRVSGLGSSPNRREGWEERREMGGAILVCVCVRGGGGGGGGGHNRQRLNTQ